MKILYLANIRMPTERAHGTQIMKTCEALTGVGVLVELAVSNRKTPFEADPFTYYGTHEKFPIFKIPVIDTVSWGRFGFFFESVVFAFGALRYARRREAIMYSRDEIVLGILAFFTRKRMVWESHTGAWNWCARYVTRHAQAVVVITQGLKDFYIARGVPAEKLMVLHDGVDLEMFECTESKEAARKRLGIDFSAKVALYVGRVDMWKGAETLFAASERIAPDIHTVIIGGEEKQLGLLKQKYPSVQFVGPRPYSELPNNLAASDCVVLPTTAKDAIGTSFTSPLKLFAYMAAGKPIVASDVPSTREVLLEEMAYWFRPDDAEDLARAIRFALGDSAASHKAHIAQREVVRYTWKTRARSLVSLFKTL